MDGEIGETEAKTEVADVGMRREGQPVLEAACYRSAKDFQKLSRFAQQ